MARVFPIEEWASSTHESQSPALHDDTMARDSFEPAHAFFPTSRARTRQESLPLDATARFQKLSIRGDHEQTRNVGKREGGIRGLFRRASISIKAKRHRRHSHLEERPSTSSQLLNKLRGAASFSRHSRIFPEDYDYEIAPVDSCEELMAPIPGFGDAPPVIVRLISFYFAVFFYESQEASSCLKSRNSS